MASQSETRNPIRHFPRRTASKGHAVKISAPMLTYTDAENRLDLYTLPPRITRSMTTHSLKPTRSKLKKKIHIADLTVGRNPPFPSAAPTFSQKPVTSPTTVGVTLGSPTYWPSARPSARRGSLDSCLPPRNDIAVVPSGLQSSGALNKESRRNLFSNFFGRKPSVKARNEFYKIQPSQIPKTLVAVDGQRTADQKVQRMPSTPTSTTARLRNQGIRKPLGDTRPRLERSATTPFEYPSRPPSPPPKDFPPRPPVSIQKVAETCANCPVQSPILKINIPDITLERYSVMFKDVLKPRQSLLARRHAQLKDLEISDSIPVSSTSSSNISTNVYVQEVPMITHESGEGNSAAAPSSQLLPHKIFFPERSSSGLGVSQRTGLSRSNTLPTLIRQPQPTSAHSKRTDPHIVRARSPSYGSETPNSMHSEWQSQESPGVSDTSDEDFDDGMCENIIIQLEDLSLPHGPPIQRGPGFTKELQDSSVLTFSAIKQPPIHEFSRLQNFTEQSQYSARELLHNKASTPANHNLLPFSAISSGNGVVAPSGHLMAEQRQQFIPPGSHSQQTTARPFHHLNPLTSSPASPTEITTARQLSWTRSQQIALVNTKQAVQPRITIVESSPVSKLNVSDILTVGHARNRSEHVVVESV